MRGRCSASKTTGVSPRALRAVAVSAPMNPPPMTATVAPSGTVARRAFRPSMSFLFLMVCTSDSSLKGILLARVPVAITMCVPLTVSPFSSVTVWLITSSDVAETPKIDVMFALSSASSLASTVLSISHLPESTCLESGGRSYGT